MMRLRKVYGCFKGIRRPVELGLGMSLEVKCCCLALGAWLKVTGLGFRYRRHVTPTAHPTTIRYKFKLWNRILEERESEWKIC
jgi:hypothetical protein